MNIVNNMKYITNNNHDASTNDMKKHLCIEAPISLPTWSGHRCSPHQRQIARAVDGIAVGFVGSWWVNADESGSESWLTMVNTRDTQTRVI